MGVRHNAVHNYDLYHQHQSAFAFAYIEPLALFVGFGGGFAGGHAGVVIGLI
jgi:hypothetical protein